MSSRHLPLAMTLALFASTSADAGWQTREKRQKCVRPKSELSEQQSQDLRTAVRGGGVLVRGGAEVAASRSSTTSGIALTQAAFDQAWIRYELCVALDNNSIDRATYQRLLEASIAQSMGQAPAVAAPAPAPAVPAPAAAPPMPEATPAPEASSSESAQTWQDQIRAQTALRAGPGYAGMADKGFTRTNGEATGLLKPGESREVSLELQPGFEYAVMGVCDNDCGNLDLAIVREGEQTEDDTSEDDWPIVTLVPDGREMAAVVSMQQCRTVNCGYQITLWRRAQTAPETQPVPSTSASDFQPLQAGGSVAGQLGSGDSTLSTGEYVDRYTLSVDAGRTVVVDLQSSAFDPYLMVRLPDGAEQRNDDCEGSSQRSCLAVTSSTAGEMRVWATSFRPGDSGSYTLTTTAGSDADTQFEAGTLGPGDGQLDEGGEYYDSYSVELRQGQRVYLLLKSSEFDSYLLAIPPEGEQLSNDDCSSGDRDACLEFVAPVSGTWRVVVTSNQGGESGDYELYILSE